MAERSVRDLRDVPRSTVPLQYNRGEERLREERRLSRQQSWFSKASSSKSELDTSSSSSSSTSSVPKRQVSFGESVAVVPIPMRTEYSSRVQNKLWSDAVEMCENVGKS